MTNGGVPRALMLRKGRSYGRPPIVFKKHVHRRGILPVDPLCLCYGCKAASPSYGRRVPDFNPDHPWSGLRACDRIRYI